MALGPYRTQTRPPEVLPTDPGLAAKGNCPGCRGELRATEVELVPVRACSQCGGHFVTHREMDRLAAARRRKGPASTVLHAPTNTHSADRTVECVTCSQPMKTAYFCHGCPVLVDVCVEHGTWFDRLELEFALDSIQQGAKYRRPDAPPRRTHPPSASPTHRGDAGVIDLLFADIADLAVLTHAAAERHDTASIEELLEELVAKVHDLLGHR